MRYVAYMETVYSGPRGTKPRVVWKIHDTAKVSTAGNPRGVRIANVYEEDAARIMCYALNNGAKDDPKARLTADLLRDAANHRGVAIVALRRIFDAAVSSVDTRATVEQILGIAQRALKQIEENRT